MTINEIAKAYGISASAVKKWPLQKRKQAIADLNHGINPIIAQLVAECAMEAYRASKRLGKNVQFDPFICNCDFFRVFTMKSDDNDLNWIVSNSELTAENLRSAIHALQACK